MSMKNCNDTIGNRTRDLPTCSAVPQPTALPRARTEISYFYLNMPRIYIGNSWGKGWCSGRFTHYEIFPSTHGIKALVVTSAGLDVTGKRMNPCSCWEFILPYSTPCLFTHLFGLGREQEHGVPCRVFFYFFVWCTEPYSQRPRGLRLRSVGAVVLRLWIRIPPGAWMSVCAVHFQVGVPATSWSLVQRSLTDWCVVMCDLETSWIRRPWPTEGCGTKNKQNGPYAVIVILSITL